VGLLYGVGFAALWVSGGCGESPTGVRGEATGRLKEQSVEHGKKMKEYYTAKKASKAPMPKPGKAAMRGRPR
jgi:hypothetical protein